MLTLRKSIFRKVAARERIRKKGMSGGGLGVLKILFKHVLKAS